MFSRSSSVASLDSRGGNTGSNGPQIHNKMLSKYNGGPLELNESEHCSGAPSGPVSPSDLPDSPGEFSRMQRKSCNSTVNTCKNKSEEMYENNEGNNESLETDSVRIYCNGEKSGQMTTRSLSPLTVENEPIFLKSRSWKKPENRADDNSCSLKHPNTNASNGKSRVNNSSDEVKIFAVEGTPFYGLSSATSFSDLCGDLSTTSSVRGGTNPKLQNNVNNNNPEPIYSDTQLLQKCIRVGRAKGFKGAHSSSSHHKSSINAKKPTVLSDKEKDGEALDPDLADLIMIGRKAKKDGCSSKGSSQNSSERETSISKGKPAVKPKPRIPRSHTVISSPLLTTNESVPVIPEEKAMNLVKSETPKEPEKPIEIDDSKDSNEENSSCSEPEDASSSSNTGTFTCTSLSISRAGHLVSDMIQKNTPVAPEVEKIETSQASNICDVTPPCSLLNQVSDFVEIGQSSLNQKAGAPGPALMSSGTDGGVSNLLGQQPPSAWLRMTDMESSMASIRSDEIFGSYYCEKGNEASYTSSGNTVETKPEGKLEEKEISYSNKKTDDKENKELSNIKRGHMAYRSLGHVATRQWKG